MEETLTTLDRSKQMEAEIIEWRRRVHAQPELGFQEYQTAGLAAEMLFECGYQVRTGVGKTGVVADRGSGVTVAVRAEMDALPIAEANRVLYVSQVPGVSHGCGHDANLACVLGAARILSQARIQGAIRILAQPAAEECADEAGKTGTYAMIEQGALENVAAIIALHVDATLPAGKVGILLEPALAAASLFAVTIEADPQSQGSESAADAVLLGCQAIQSIHKLAKKRSASVNEPIVTIGSFQSSSGVGDVISQQAVLKGSFRSFSKEMRKAIMSELEEALSCVVEGGGQYKISYGSGQPQALNHAEITEVMRQAACDLIGPSNVLGIKRKTWVEDFSKFTEVVPGAMMLLGAEIATSRRSHHSPHFDIDESCLYIGAAILAETAIRLSDVLNSDRE